MPEHVFHAVVDHDLMPHPRLAYNKKALRIPRNRVTNRAVARTLDYLANRDELALKFKVAPCRFRFHSDQKLMIKAGIWLSDPLKQPDLDNLTKTLFDALQEGGIIPNDKAIRRCFIDIHDMAPKGMVAVEISLL